MKNTSRILALVLALVMCFALAACSNTNNTADGSAANDEAGNGPTVDTGDSDLAYVQDKGVLVVGITDFEPMDYQNDKGDWIGFDADMAAAFAESLSVDVEFVEINWDNKVLELNSGTVDCIWNGMTLTDEVTSAMDCGVPYCNNAQVVVVRADVADQYQTVESLEGLVFAVEAGSAGEAAVKELGNDYNPVETQAAALMEVSAGTSDACVIDSLMAAAMIGEGTSYADLTYTVGLTEEFYGVGFRQGSDLVAAFNAFFAAAVADGSAEQIAETYGVQAALIKE